MNYLIFFLIVLVFIIFLVIPTLCERRVVGGVKIQITNYPFMVSIQKNKVHQCGGTLVTLSWVLTASHCLYNKKGEPIDLKELSVLAGTTEFSKYSLMSPVMQEESVIYATTFSGKPSAKSTDVALVQTAKPFRENRAVSIVRLPDKIADDTNKYEALKIIITKPCQVIGWGFTQEVAPGGELKIKKTDMSDHLMVGEVNIIAPKVCREKHSRAGTKILSIHICTLSKKADACVGDSGGPLICDGTQYGIISFGFGCRDDFPGVNVRTDFFLSWIRSQITSSSSSVDPQQRSASITSDTDTIIETPNESEEIQNRKYEDTKNTNEKSNDQTKHANGKTRGDASCRQSQIKIFLILFFIAFT